MNYIRVGFDVCPRPKKALGDSSATDVRHARNISGRVDQSQERKLDSNRLGCDWSKTTMSRSVTDLAVVWGKERGLTNLLEIKPYFTMEKSFCFKI